MVGRGPGRGGGRRHGATVAGAADLAAVDDVTALLVLPAVVEDPAAAAAKLAAILGGDEATYLADLSKVDEDNVRLDVVTTTEERTALKAAIDAGELAGVEFQPVSTMAVAGRRRRHVRRRRRRDDRDGGARGRRGRPGPGQRRRRRDPALRHLHGRHDRRPRDHRDRDHRRPRGERARGHARTSRCRARHARRLRRRRGARGGAGDDAGRRRDDRLRRRAAREERLRRPPAAVRADGAGPRPQRGLPDHQPRLAARLRGRRRGRLARRRLVHLRVATARRDHGRAHGGGPVPAGAGPVPASLRRRARRAVRAAGRDVLRPEPDRDERRLHGLLHPRRLPAVRVAVAGTRTRQALLLAGDARHRRPPGPGARLQVGRRVRDRRAGDPRADPLGARPDPAHRRA